MKSKAKELDVDFIGGQGSLTQEEQEKISAYINAEKQRLARVKPRVTKALRRKKILA